MSTLNKPVCITLNQVSFFGYNKVILKDIQIDVHHHGLHLFTGPNGSGKSTLFEILATIKNPSKGSIRFYSDDNNDIEHVKQRMGYVCNQSLFFDEMTFWENINLLNQINHQEPISEQTCDFPFMSNMKKLYNQKIRLFSKGEKQKANIIRSLLFNPAIVIWDEPESGLDAQAQDELMTWIENDRLKRTYLIASHSPHLFKNPSRQFELLDGKLT